MPTSLTEKLTRSVLAVPPLARKTDLTLDDAENTKLIRHIEAGGIRTLLYGGNANFYHIALKRVRPGARLSSRRRLGRDTLVIPSVGPAFGTMMDQAKIVRRHKFPTVMVLPHQGITTADGVEEGIRRFVQAAGIPALLYIKHEGYIEPENVKRLADEGLISGIKYAIVRADPANDEYLPADSAWSTRKSSSAASASSRPSSICGTLGSAASRRAASASPRVSRRKCCDAIRARRPGNRGKDSKHFQPLEDLRNAINPIRVLHEAVRLAGIADTGPLLPLMSNLPESDHRAVGEAAAQLLKKDQSCESRRASFKNVAPPHAVSRWERAADPSRNRKPVGPIYSRTESLISSNASNLPLTRDPVPVLAARPTHVRYWVMAFLCVLSFLTYFDRVCIMRARGTSSATCTFRPAGSAWA